MIYRTLIVTKGSTRGKENALIREKLLQGIASLNNSQIMLLVGIKYLLQLPNYHDASIHQLNLQ